MGGWSFVEPRLRALGMQRRSTSAATPAPARRPARTQVHQREQTELVEAALAGTVPHLVRDAEPGADGRQQAHEARAADEPKPPAHELEPDGDP